MNLDDIKPILDSLELKITDHWISPHIFPKKKVYCYFYTFDIDKVEYCISGDGIMYSLCTRQSLIYLGYNIEELERILKDILAKGGLL